MLRHQAGGAIAELHQQHLVIPFLIFSQRIFPRFRLSERRIDALDFIRELVVKKFIKENLGDNLIFVAVVAEAKIGTDTFQVIDQGGGLFLKVS